MSEQTPYNNEQWNELPLPDGEASWQKMELLLDKEKKRRAVPFWWRFAGLLLLLITTVSLGLWFWNSSDDSQQKTKTNTTLKQDVANETPSATKTKQENTTIAIDEQRVIKSRDSVLHTETEISHILGQKKVLVKGGIIQQSPFSVQTTSVKKVGTVSIKKSSPQTGKLLIEDKETKKQPQVNSTETTKPTLTAKTTPSGVQDSLKTSNTTVVKDSASAKDSTTVTPSPPVVKRDDKKIKSKKHPPLLWSAGVGLQQPIALNGQQSSGYNYYGKRSTVSDYIPSVYVRLQWKQWYLQAEGNYSVPQPLKTIAFSQTTTYNAATFLVSTERVSIDKIYYHQLPISVNYLLMEHWSVGIGSMYNILAGAVTTKETTNKNVLTGAETISKELAPVKGYKDSFLYKTTAGLLVQTDYHWKRFSLGLRYTKNLQPFIKYTRPNGSINDEKAAALQAILRFRLWGNK